MTHIPARPTTYKGIQMRSRLEADYAASLDHQGYRWAYEPQCFASDAGQWLPDFGCTFGDEGPLAIFDEIKPAEPLERLGASDLYDRVDALLGQMVIAWESRPDAHLRLIFWRYGGTPYLTLHGHSSNYLWFAEFGIQPAFLLWPGMGQCRAAAEQKAAS